MRAVIFCVQVLIAVLLTASMMPLVLVAVPAAQSHPGFGLGLMGGVFILSIAVLTLVWPRRKT